MISSFLLNSSADVERLSVVRRDTGFEEAVFATVASDVSVRIEPHRDAVRMQEGGRLKIGDWLMFAPNGVDIQRTDRITAGGLQYEVVDILDAAGHGHHQEIGLVEDDRPEVSAGS